MIYRNEKELIARYIGEVAIQYIYLGGRLLWPADASGISSCFGSGAWINDEVWNNNDAWKN